MPKNNFGAFFKLESTSGILLIVAAVTAMILRNSPRGAVDESFLDIPIQFRLRPIDFDNYCSPH